MSNDTATVRSSRVRTFIYLAGFGATMLGSGSAAPYLAVFVVHYRGVSVGELAVIFAVESVVSIVINPLGSLLSTRVGTIRVFAAGVVFQGLGQAIFLLGPGSAFAFAAMVVFGIGSGLAYSAAGSAIFAMFGSDRIRWIFSTQAMVTNAAVAVGAILGGLLVGGLGVLAYPLLIGFNALSYVLFASILVIIRRAGVRDFSSAESSRSSAAQVFRPFRDRRFLVVLAIQFVVAAFGISQLDAVIPLLWFSDFGYAGIATGVLFAINACFVVGLQIPVRRIVERRGNRFGIVGVLVAWIGTFSLGLTATLIGPTPAAYVSFAVAVALFALGEAFMASSMQPLLIGSAPVDRLPHYTAAGSLVYSVALIVGPALGLLVWNAVGGVVYWTSGLILLVTVAVIFILTKLGAVSDA